jgi:hypothetical protein
VPTGIEPSDLYSTCGEGELGLSMTNAVSGTMREVLATGIEDREVSGPLGTVRALERRGLIDADRRLTLEGRAEALASASLQEQCRHLGLAYREVEVPLDDRPEVCARRHFEEQGYVGASCEGRALFLVVQAAILDYLATINELGSREDAATRYLEAQLTVHADRVGAMAEALEDCTAERFASAIPEVLAGAAMLGSCTDLTPAVAATIFAALHPHGLRQMLGFLTEAPYDRRSGWPDLTLVKDGAVHLVEVKTTDRLHRSQLVTMPAIVERLGFDVSVLRIAPA